MKYNQNSYTSRETGLNNINWCVILVIDTADITADISKRKQHPKKAGAHKSENYQTISFILCIHPKYLLEKYTEAEN